MLLVITTHITKLRVQFAAKEVPPSALERLTREAFEAIEGFSPESWAKAKDVNFYEGAATTGIGQVYQMAVRLYALLSLPRSAVDKALAMRMGSPTSPTTPATPGSPATTPSSSSAAPGDTATMGSRRDPSTYDGVRVAQRDELVKAVIRDWDAVKAKDAFTWPLTVAGVAMADGPTEERDAMERLLYEVWHPLAIPIPWIVLGKLRAFWRSGGTRWEDCFWEPTPP